MSNLRSRRLVEWLESVIDITEQYIKLRADDKLKRAPAIITLTHALPGAPATPTTSVNSATPISNSIISSVAVPSSVAVAPTTLLTSLRSLSPSSTVPWSLPSVSSASSASSASSSVSSISASSSGSAKSSLASVPGPSAGLATTATTIISSTIPSSTVEISSSATLEFASSISSSSIELVNTSTALSAVTPTGSPETPSQENKENPEAVKTTQSETNRGPAIGIAFGAFAAFAILVIAGTLAYKLRKRSKPTSGVKEIQ